MRIGRNVALGLVMALLGAAASAAPEWLYPNAPPAPPPDLDRTISLPGSRLVLKAGDLRLGNPAPDWYPQAHPPAPPAVLVGQPKVFPCGYCHLPTGAGRPENASLAGLDADYIVRQVAAFSNGERGSVRPTFRPYALMRETARATDPAEVEQAARYFASVPRRSFVRVVEAATIPAVIPGAGIWRRADGTGREPLGQRLIELADDEARFEARDPNGTYTAFVPPGAIGRGRKLARGLGETAGVACSTCHGVGEAGGGIAPPLAGRSPSYLARQLHAFRAGVRANAEAAPMLEIARRLDDGAIIDLAAFLAAQPVNGRR